MKRTHLLTVAAVFGAGIALVDLVTGWTARSAYLGLAFELGLFLSALALYVAMVVAGLREPRRPAGIRWGATFAIAFAVLLFANCSSAVTSSAEPGAQIASQDAAVFLSLSGWVLMPLLLALALPAVLVAIGRASLATWAAGAIVLVVLATAAGGFYAGMSQCAFGGSVGWCAAGFGSITNLFSLGALALLLPYTGRANEAPAS